MKFLSYAPALLFALLVSATSASATVTLQFSQTNVARATGFANSAGTPTNGMAWGIVVDSSGNGFSDASYDVFSSSVPGFLNAGGSATDDYYITTGLLTSNQTATGTDPGGAGGITALANIFSSYPAGVGAGDAFKIIWFETTPALGTNYGTFGDAQFTLPPDSNTQSYATVFDSGTSADAAKPASLTFGGTAAPEPSRTVLAFLGLAMVGLRRRRR